MLPTLQPVASSMIIEAGYKSDTNKLFVRFAGGKLYCYDGVPSGEYEAFLHAESQGKYLNSVIKPNYTATLVS